MARLCTLQGLTMEQVRPNIQNLLTTKIHGTFERLKETDDDDQELCVIVQKYGQGVAKKGW